MRKVIVGCSLLMLALLSPRGSAAQSFAPEDVSAKDLDAASAALLQAEAELLDALDRSPAAAPAKAAAPKESPKASLRSEVKTAAPAPAAKTAVAAAKAAEQPAVRVDVKPAAPVKNDEAQPFKSMTKEISGELDTLHGENTALKSQVKFQGKTVESLQSENRVLREQLAQSQNQMKTLIARMSQMRNSLMVAETEVERLNSIVQDINHASARGEHYRAQQTYGAPPREAQRDALLTRRQEQKASEDMPIATVIVDKANLRAGPGMGHSPIMSIAKGTRLAIETKSGDWYRVVAPTGERAWISRDTVAYGRDAKSSPSRTVRVKSYDPSIEDEAMELVRKAGARY